MVSPKYDGCVKISAEVSGMCNSSSSPFRFSIIIMLILGKKKENMFTRMLTSTEYQDNELEWGDEVRFFLHSNVFHTMYNDLMNSDSIAA